MSRCTKKVCLKKEKPKCLKSVEDLTCSTGCSSWFDGCNACSCMDGKVGACTEMACPNSKGQPKCLDKPATPSTPIGKGYCSKGCRRWFDGCNMCQCSIDGKIAGCTEKECKEKSRPKCVDESTRSGTSVSGGGVNSCPRTCSRWYDGCNACSCKDGKIGACTKKACLRKERPKCLDEMVDTLHAGADGVGGDMHGPDMTKQNGTNTDDSMCKQWKAEYERKSVAKGDAATKDSIIYKPRSESTPSKTAGESPSSSSTPSGKAVEAPPVWCSMGNAKAKCSECTGSLSVLGDDLSMIDDNSSTQKGLCAAATIMLCAILANLYM